MSADRMPHRTHELQATVSAVVEPIDTHDFILFSFSMFDFLLSGLVDVQFRDFSVPI